MILTLSEADVAKVLKYEQLIPAMEKALSAFSAGRVIQPVRNMLTIEEGKRFLGIMPAVAEEGMGAKLWRRIGYLRISYRMRCVWLVMSWQWSSPTRSDAMRPRPDHVSSVSGSRYFGFTSWAFGSLEGLSVLSSISRRARRVSRLVHNLIVQRALQVREIVGQDRDQLPTFFASLAQQLDLAALARHVVERELAVLPFNHEFVPFWVN